jgi:hypothetical protein
MGSNLGYSTEKSLKVPLRGTFKLFSGFHVSAERCRFSKIIFSKIIVDHRDRADQFSQTMYHKLFEYCL